MEQKFWGIEANGNTEDYPNPWKVNTKVFKVSTFERQFLK